MSPCVSPCATPDSSPETPAKWSASRSDAARPVADLSTPSANRFGGGSSSGRTTDSDTGYLGSNPSPPAKNGRGPAHAGLRLLRPWWYFGTMTPGERKILLRGVAGGTMLGLALGLMIALVIAIKPHLFAGLIH